VCTTSLGTFWYRYLLVPFAGTCTSKMFSYLIPVLRIVNSLVIPKALTWEGNLCVIVKVKVIVHDLPILNWYFYVLTCLLNRIFRKLVHFLQMIKSLSKWNCLAFFKCFNYLGVCDDHSGERGGTLCAPDRARALQYAGGLQETLPVSSTPPDFMSSGYKLRKVF